ncbi:hypothetical protein BC827DRAFT_711889 [Russula dissimulans]|nr:hypothetical protein BC827DRAFT_711889 [Russula dissimulans]
MTWDLIGKIQVTDDSQVLPALRPEYRVQNGSEVYESLTYTIMRGYSSSSLTTPLTLRPSTSDRWLDGELTGPRGVLHNLITALGVHDAYNDIIPPSWAHDGRVSGRYKDNTAPYCDRETALWGINLQLDSKRRRLKLSKTFLRSTQTVPVCCPGFSRECMLNIVNRPTSKS